MNNDITRGNKYAYQLYLQLPYTPSFLAGPNINMLQPQALEFGHYIILINSLKK